MKTVTQTIKFATIKHNGQVRKGSNLPYITHPIAVSKIVEAHKVSKKLDELIIASILHDTLEDTDTTFTELTIEFSPLVASLVLELSNCSTSIKKMGKLEYQKKKMLGMSSYGLLIKLADRLHNISDQPTEKMVSDTIELIAFIQSNRILSLSQTCLSDKILKLCKKL